MKHFTATIEIIGINPYVLLPESVLEALFEEAKKDKGPIPVKGKLDGKHSYKQTLVKYSGKWRLYINGPMLTATKKTVGDELQVQIGFDPEERTIPFHPKLKKAIEADKEAKAAFAKLAPSLQKEIKRYISYLKTEESIERNIKKAIGYLKGKERFVGRDPKGEK
jgi:hypothetical protein